MSHIISTPVSSSVPFDNTTNRGFSADTVQEALEDLRTKTVYIARTQATTLNGTLTLLSDDFTLQTLTGTATGYSVVLPNATTCTIGRHYKIDNVTNQSVAVKDATGTLLFNLSPSSICELTLRLNTTVAGGWIFWQNLIGVANGVITYNIVTSTPFTTSSTTDVVITGFTVTPQSGTYGVWYSASVFYTTTPIAHYWSIYRAGVQVADSARTQDTSHSNQNLVDTTMSIINFNGSQTCDIRVRRGTSGALTVNQRSLLLIRLGA